MAQVNKSCLTDDIWLHAVIQYLTDQKVNQLRYAREWPRAARGRVAPD